MPKASFLLVIIAKVTAETPPLPLIQALDLVTSSNYCCVSIPGRETCRFYSGQPSVVDRILLTRPFLCVLPIIGPCCLLIGPKQKDTAYVGDDRPKWSGGLLSPAKLAERQYCPRSGGLVVVEWTYLCQDIVTIFRSMVGLRTTILGAHLVVLMADLTPRETEGLVVGQQSLFRSVPTTVKTSENDTVLLPCYVDNLVFEAQDILHCVQKSAQVVVVGGQKVAGVPDVVLCAGGHKVWWWEDSKLLVFLTLCCVQVVTRWSQGLVVGRQQVAGVLDVVLCAGGHKVRWWWGSKLLVDSSDPDVTLNSRIKIFPNNTLQVSDLRAEDTGEYKCQVIRPKPWGLMEQLHAIEVL
ncbi:unnamed protein product, partial [Timema podura]|nr:unnamed protein product [Timema podura]